jgi:signal recognition particle receptor subunit beta
MAVFDLRERRICVRIVYDGFAGAGKTTNVRQLAALFAAQRKTELYTPAEVDGRTLFFDWLQIHGGVVCGFPLLCQVITVPGQVVLSERRRHLLSTADAVVYVADSGGASLALARDGLTTVDEVCRARVEAPPLVIQANKQDQDGAVAGAVLLEHIGRAGTPCVEAIARDGIGVVDTFVRAVRELTRRLQQRIERGEDMKMAVMPVEGPRAVLAQLEALAIDPEWAAEMLLEQAANAFVALGTVASPLPEDAPGPVVDETSAPFPRPDVPPGFVWPAHTGRARLRALAGALDVVPLDHDGDAIAMSSGFRLVTSRADHFMDVDAAKQAIVRTARERTQLGSLLAPETVVVLQPANDGESWLWTIVPSLPSVREWLAGATSEAERRARLEKLAVAMSDALSFAMRHGLALDLSPERFGIDDDTIRYLGALTAASADTPTQMVETMLREASSWPDLAFFVDTLEVELDRRSRFASNEAASVADAGTRERVMSAITRGRGAFPMQP